ncbi:MAG TPA: hypothetical protein VL860_04085, partial [Planctomycetota bacterium]|nr:hypothetical protein [Planctomycetota bacterium]
MIQVNLLPPEKRPPEGTSPARLTAIILGVLVPVLGLLLDVSYISKTRELNEEATTLDAKNNDLQNQINDLKDVTKKIAEIEKKTTAIDDLRKNRMLWGRFHYRFFQMMTALDNSDTQQQENNVIVRRFSMRREANDKYNIDLGM